MSVTPGPWKVYRCTEAKPDRACGIQGSPDPNIAWQVREGYSDVVCDTNHEECCHMMKLADAEHIVNMHNKLDALRTAWINIPFDSVVSIGTAEWLQPLVGAVSEIVDPNRTLREEPEVKRIGTLASFKAKLIFANHQMDCANKIRDNNVTAEQSVKEWTDRRNELIAQCKAELGVDLETQ